ncbi:sensor histidine kinase [Geminocystis sp.]|uniref:sensor histidine kinase n=1 Tax=Geminocystis sp. TaxID=2664100 RepID=UPI0035942DF3
MQNNLIFNKINYRKINDNLLSLLETSDNIDYFCQCCDEMLSEYLKLNIFIIIDTVIDKFEEIKVVYSKENNTPYQEYLHKIYNQLIASREKCLNNDNLKRENNFLNSQDQKYDQINYIDILPLNFKKKALGYLLLEVEIFDYSEIEVKKVLNIITQYLAIYLYQISIENKEKDLQKEEEKLKKSKENQSKYLSYMNHELRTPLVAIIEFSKMLQQKIYGDLNPKQDQYIDAIYQSGKYLLDLINDLLDISKIEAKKEDLVIEKILVNELCESSLALIKTKADEENLQLILTIANDVKYCYVDQRRIKQVLLNLLSNAVKFTEVGSITLDVKQENNYLKFNIIDTGIGINLKYQQQLFQPFFQLNTPLHRHHRGTGLGLVIARELARLHGGDITLISEENKGSCFTLSLPILDPNSKIISINESF